jgi:hypothetical protein
MKKLLLFAIAVTIPLAAQAVVSVDQTTSPEMLMKSGFSKQTADIVNVSKARATGQEYYTDDEKAFKKQNAFVRFWRKLYVYADPAAEDYSYYHHSTTTTPSYTDL